MKAAGVAAFGWLVPGGAYLLLRRYLQFAISLALVCGATAAGLALHGANLWPQPDELHGLDGFNTTLAHAGALAKALAGGPYLLARACDYSHTFLSGPTHEYGTTLLVLAGIFNLLALVDGMELRKRSHA
jgi:hypothetical protein